MYHSSLFATKNKGGYQVRSPLKTISLNTQRVKRKAVYPSFSLLNVHINNTGTFLVQHTSLQHFTNLTYRDLDFPSYHSQLLYLRTSFSHLYKALSACVQTRKGEESEERKFNTCKMKDDESTERESWSSRFAYLVATIGGAIGFGNIWRFPSLAYQYGGGAFFIPYFLALFLIGIPLLILECIVGQTYQTGDAGAFGRVHKRFRGVGLASVSCSFVVVSYYSVLLAWTCRMFVYSCGNSAGWRGEAGSAGFNWFLEQVTGLGKSVYPTHLVGENVAALAVVWVLIFLCLVFGVHWTGRISYVTVFIPIFTLIVLLVRAVTLDGARRGIIAYIGKWKVSQLSSNPSVWSEAVTQIFFSIGVTFGYITAYSSYNKRNSPVFSNSLIISLSNSAYSIIAGFAVFAIVGYLSKMEDTEIKDLNVGGPGLMFGTFPAALSSLPGGGHWERLLFITLILLGIDSAFALTEAVVTVLQDSLFLRKVPKAFIVLGVCLCAFSVGLLFCTNTGLFFLDTVDWYINFMLLLVGFFECVAVGWVYGVENQMMKVGQLPVLALAVTEFAPWVVACGVWFNLRQRSNLPPEGWTAGSWALLWGFVAVFVTGLLAVTFLFFTIYDARFRHRESSSLTMIQYVTELLMGNVLSLRQNLTPIVKYIPFIWFVMIRHVIPQMLLILFANLASSRITLEESKKKVMQFGNYGEYKTVYQVIGILCFVAAAVIIGVGLIFPDLYQCLDVAGVKEEHEQNSESVNNMVDAQKTLPM